MESLKNFILEGIFDMDNVVDVSDEAIIMNWIEENTNGYDPADYEYNSKTKKVNAKKSVSMVEGSETLTNGMFEWGVINGDFDCSYCNIKTLKGGPDYVESVFICEDCVKLTNFQYAPSHAKTVWAGNCPNLQSIEGCPEVDNDIVLNKAIKLTSIKGLPKKVRSLSLQNCTSLKSLEGCPKEVTGIMDIRGCTEIKNLKGIGKVRKLFVANNKIRNIKKELEKYNITDVAGFVM